MKSIRISDSESMTIAAYIALVASRFAIVLAVLLTAQRSGYLIGSIVVSVFFVLRESIDIVLANAMRSAGLIRKNGAL